MTRDSEFGVFKNAEAVRFIVAPRAFSRSEIQRLEDLAKEWGAKGLAYVVVDDDGEVRSPIAKFLSPAELAAFEAPPGSTVLFGAGSDAAVLRVLGLLRLHLGRELGLIDPEPRRLPLGARLPALRAGRGDRAPGRSCTTRSPRPSPAPRSGTKRTRRDVRGQHYDLVWNGWELGSGSIRIHDVELQQRVFRTIGLTEEEAQSKFGYLLEALAMGAPPHGGFAMGIERFIALMAGEPDIRQVIAFPKVSSGSDPLTGAPTPMPDAVLRELGVQAVPGGDLRLRRDG